MSEKKHQYISVTAPTDPPAYTPYLPTDSPAQKTFGTVKQVHDEETGAGQLSRNSTEVDADTELWHRNMKIVVTLTVVVLVILAISIGVIVWQMQSK